MGFKTGIVGLPNVGKSTLFNALTCSARAAENFAFCTIEPNIGEVAVPDARLKILAHIARSHDVIAARMRFVDIAGLVKGASRGEGLGNQFLATIRECDAIAHVVRCFDDNDIIHIHDRVDPIVDVEIIETELMLADLQTIQRRLQRLSRGIKSGDKKALATEILLQRAQEKIEMGVPARVLDISKEQRDLWASLQLLSSKPVLYVCNVEEGSVVHGNQYSAAIFRLAAQQKARGVIVSAAIEAEIAVLAPKEAMVFLNDLGLVKSGLNRVISAGYDLLSLQTFFTAGAKETRAWTIKQGTKASRAAGIIHSDFERGFIRAETISYNDYVAYNGEQGAREAGKMRIEGKSYILADGDVVHFLFNV